MVAAGDVAHGLAIGQILRMLDDFMYRIKALRSARRPASSADRLCRKPGLVRAGRAARIRKISDEQLAQVEAAVVKGPQEL